MLAPHNSGYAAKEGMDGPTIVSVNTMIRSISKIDDYKMVSSAIFRPCTDRDCHEKMTQTQKHVHCKESTILLEIS